VYTPNPNGVQQDLALGGAGSNNFSMTLYGTFSASQQTAVPGSYSWSSGASPSIQYGYASGTTCPTGGKSTSSSGSSWTATVLSTATLSVTNLNFGATSSQITSAIPATATLTVQATNSTPYSISLDNGVNASGTQRRMQLGATAKYVNYNLYTDAANSSAWSTTSSASSCTGGANTCDLGTGAGSNQTYTIYGQVPAQTAPATGLFSDTVVVTVLY
jgi:spore coat protein U-like protein